VLSGCGIWSPETGRRHGRPGESDPFTADRQGRPRPGSSDLEWRRHTVRM